MTRGGSTRPASAREINRPRDPTSNGSLTIFTMPDPALASIPDATKQAPFEVGDFVTYSGILVKDGSEPTAGPRRRAARSSRPTA